MNSGKKGHLDEFYNLVSKYVNKSHPVLEAGCGPGHLVAALLAHGYNATGIDYEPDAVKFGGQHLPPGTIQSGNVLALDMPDSSVGCYFSVGVLEHFIDGPELVLSEARRVLRKDGVALISVPYLNPMRHSYFEVMKKLGVAIPTGYHFHQYYFLPKDFDELLAASGFEVIDWFPYALKAFLTREHPLISRIWNSRLIPYRVKKQILVRLEKAPLSLRRKYGHMVMFVCHPT